MLSVGPYSYNRFDAYEKSLQEASKPDFLDKDGDGDKEESFKKALKDKKENPFAKKSDKKDDEGTCSKCGGDHDEDKHDKKDVKEGYADAIAKSTAKFGKGALDTAKKSAGAVNKAINTVTGRKGMKEAVMNALMADGLVNNPISAEIMVEHMSDEWFDQVVQNLD